MYRLLLSFLLCSPAGATEYKDLLRQVHAAEDQHDLKLETALLMRAVKAWTPEDGRANLRVSLSNLGLDLFDQHRFADALTCYDQALQIDPRHAITHANRASALDSLHRWHEAMADIALADKYGDAHTKFFALEAYCVSYITFDRYAEALPYCEQVVESDRSVKPLQQLAEVYAHLGRTKEAEALLAASITAPNREQYNELDRWLYEPNARVAQAVVWEFTGQAGKADDALSRLVESLPDKPYPLYRRGRLRLDTGFVNPAIADLTRVVALEPDFAEAYAWRAVAYDKVGKPDFAIADRAKACGMGWKPSCPAKGRGR